MKHSNLYKLIIGGCVITGAIILSCTKDLDKTNGSYPTLDTYYQNSSELLNATNAIYAMFHSGSLVGREWYFVQDMRSDDVSAGGGQLEVPRAQMLNGNCDPANSVMNSVWNGLYGVVLRANTVIEHGPGVTDNDALRDRCVAEAKFFRGWAYFELVSMWGGVPLYTIQITLPDQFQARAPEDQVYAQIIQDLTDAANTLPASYGDADRGRATSGAANAMLGRVYMQSGAYDKAKEALLKVVNSNLYRLVDNYMDNFLEETEFNAESIFEASYVDNTNGSNFDWGYAGNGTPQNTVRNQEYCPVAWRNLIPSNKYLNEFENTATGGAKTDPRFAMSVYQTGDTYDNGNAVLTDGDQNGNSSIVNGVTKKISWRKFMLIYKQDHTTAQFRPGGNNQRIIRYAEVLLMLAECENELGNIPGAVEYLNQVRDRPSVAMPHYPTTQFPVSTKDQVTKAIMHEKSVELGCEEIRNRDILRWRKKGYFGGTDPLSYFRANRDELLPIPQAEIDNNPKLADNGIEKQNPGY